MQDQCMPEFFCACLEKAIKNLEPRFCDGCACKELARHWTVAHVARNDVTSCMVIFAICTRSTARDVAQPMKKKAKCQFMSQ